ncbi:hypothetical protein HPB47_020729 [Ixodes persulcatus]|uniref:Uncharacterized protein n=1 Tax=Ixodes persulcatus TaxID=34615 RepID=A0AC60QGT8_IXOPE|nr:hypothetical protein HPB47_020729 [Ixodes persulcatus]
MSHASQLSNGGATPTYHAAKRHLSDSSSGELAHTISMQQDDEGAMDDSVLGSKEDGEKINRQLLSDELEALAPGQFSEVRVNTRKNIIAMDARKEAGVLELPILTKICEVPNSRVGVILDVDTDITEDRLSKIIGSGVSVVQVRRLGKTQAVKMVFAGAKVVGEQRKIKRRNKQHVEKPGTGTSQPKSQTTAQEVDSGAQGSSSPSGAAKADNPHNGGRDNHARGLTYHDVTQGTPPNLAADRKNPRYHPETQGILPKPATSVPESAERSTVSKFINLGFNTVRRLLELLQPSGFRTTLNSLLFLKGLLKAVF